MTVTPMHKGIEAVSLGDVCTELTPRSRGLASLASGASDERARELEDALAPFGEIDPEMWK